MQPHVRSVTRNLLDDRGSSIPLLVAAAALVLALAFTGYDLASLFGFKQQLQFYADQLALTSASTGSTSAATLMQRSGLTINQSFTSFSATIIRDDATVKLCQVWHPAAKLDFIVASREVCVNANAR